MDKLIFFNAFHNGDIHLSRSFVKDIMTKKNAIAYFYQHANAEKLLKDIKSLSYEPLTFCPVGVGYNDPAYFSSDSTFINTWVGQNRMYYVNTFGGCTLDAYYQMFKDIYEALGLQGLLYDKQEYLPSHPTVI